MIGTPAPEKEQVQNKERAEVSRKVVQEEPFSPPVDSKKCYKVEKVGWGENHLVTLAYELSGCDKEFLYLIEGENGNWNIKERSRAIMKNGQQEDSHGLCQLNRRWHSKIVDDPRFFTMETILLHFARPMYEVMEENTLPRLSDILFQIIFSVPFLILIPFVGLLILFFTSITILLSFFLFLKNK